MDIKQEIRDLKIRLIDSDLSIKVDTNRLPGFLYYLLPNRKIVKDMMNRGAILTGSRALKLYTLNNGIPLFDRAPNDWDFLITQKMLLEICDDYKVYETPKKGILTVRKPFFYTTDQDYGGNISENHYFKTDVHLIIKEELPTCQEVNGIKVANLTEILEFKNSLQEKGVYVDKNYRDLSQILIRIAAKS